MNLTGEELRRFLPGIYLHYKGHLYEADHLVHNASNDGEIGIHYIGLELDESHEGPRDATREFREFLFDQVHQDGSKCEHPVHPRFPSQRFLCGGARQVANRFHYLGPVFEAWMLAADPWNQ